jgi:serine/threonine protein kinase
MFSSGCCGLCLCISSSRCALDVYAFRLVVALYIYAFRLVVAVIVYVFCLVVEVFVYGICFASNARIVRHLQEVSFFDIAMGVARGMEYLHYHCHMMHRDMKSPNLLLDESGKVRRLACSSS